MTSIANTKTQWQVQTRLSRRHKWRAKGTFETRNDARAEALFLRNYTPVKSDLPAGGYGYGNTRVVRKITGGL